jgi:glyoxylase-like metal-dependent hydrolase (beta-lactamase superfamily II)
VDSPTFRFQVGTFQCRCISDGTFDYPPEDFAANVPTERFQAQLQARHLPTDHVTSPYTSLLIDPGRHKVLIDTGAGFAPTNGHLLANLRADGVAPADIDTVILTHAHADHIGGNLEGEAQPAFPNARYVMAHAEWAFWTGSPNLDPMPVAEPLKHLLIAAAQRNLPPLRPQIDLVDRETEIVPGITAIPAPGHTPGHIALLIASGDQQLLHLADTVLHPILMEHPDWYPRFDLLTAQAVATKRRLLDRAAADNLLTFVYHFAPFPSLGYVVAAGDAWKWQPVDVTGVASHP